MFILMTAKPCPAGSSAACDRFNWAISWTFFLVMSWGAALVTDVLSWRRSGGRGDRLVDFEQEVAMRRSRASRR